MQLQFTLIIPAFNEVERLPPYLNSIQPYLDRAFGGAYQVVVVDDGSRDRLTAVVEAGTTQWPQLAFCRHTVNQGKGAAVRTGVLAARGRFVMFADADGATPIEEELKLRQRIEQGADLAVGSRLHRAADVSRNRHWKRQTLGLCFAWLVRRLFSLPLRDSQCGFKMFRREVAQRLFALGQETGYLFDIEILALAHRLGYRIAEVPVSWSDVPGSKVRLMRDSWGMFCGLWRLRRSLRRRAADHPYPPSWQQSEDTAEPLTLHSSPESILIR